MSFLHITRGPSATPPQSLLNAGVRDVPSVAGFPSRSATAPHSAEKAASCRAVSATVALLLTVADMLPCTSAPLLTCGGVADEGDMCVADGEGWKPAPLL